MNILVSVYYMNRYKNNFLFNKKGIQSVATMSYSNVNETKED